ncbi:MAG: two-component sensor histidine kinase [SAR324 cluster bacterium]|nr:two-component sensor histidine kinase [SAR324 cluster bacterium]
MNFRKTVKSGWHKLKPAIIPNEEMASSKRYQVLRRNIILIMLLVTFVPLFLMTFSNYYQYQVSLKSEIDNPLRFLVNKSVHSFELFLDERLSVIRYTAASNSYEALSREETLNSLFQVLKKEIGGIIDVGVVDKEGRQIAYAGPYHLLGRDYSQQRWFHEVSLRGHYISDVFMGYREFPHIAIAVQQFTKDGHMWILRATIDSQKLNDIFRSMGLGVENDTFLINQQRILQTPSRFYGDVLETCRLKIPLGNSEAQVIEQTDDSGRTVLVAFASFIQHRFTMVLVKPKSVVLRSWNTLRNRMVFIFFGSGAVIIIAVFMIADFLVKKIRDADQKRELAFREIENTQKLSSLGRLAAGVAHEINNPMAIIDQKAGLMEDLIKMNPNFTEKEKFLQLTQSILHAVKRCKEITHRLLGFARRIEVTYEEIDLNNLVREVLGFLEKDAIFREIRLNLQLDQNLPSISSDKGQLQQVFLNLLTNAFAAVEDKGTITIKTASVDPQMVAVAVQDNGCGMSAETRAHIFEPFFTTKKGYGTGLGLPITYGIVKKLGGDLKVESTEKVGTTITVLLKKGPLENQGTV